MLGSDQPARTGRVYDVAAVGAVARQYGIPFLLDACQSIGHVPINVQVCFSTSAHQSKSFIIIFSCSTAVFSDRALNKPSMSQVP